MRFRPTIRPFIPILLLLLFTQAQVLKAVSSNAAGSYVIVTTQNIVDSSSELQNLIEQKNDEGFRVTVVTDAEWGASEADERADNIRNWLKNHWEADSIRYVLLIGNPDPIIGDVPMKLCYYDITVETFLDREIPTDFYYSELSGTWDANGDGFHGDVNTDYGVSGGADHYGEVAVGRLPYYGVMEDLDRIIRKSIDYKNATSKAWRKNALLAMRPTNEGNQAYPLGEAIKDSILIPESWNYHRIYERYNSYSKTYLEELDSLSPPVEQLSTTEEIVQNTWANNPFGFCIWWSHGTSSQSVGGIFRSSRATALNDTYPTMVYQTSCSSAFPEDTNNLAYALLKQGAITIVGPTRETNSFRGQTSFKDSPSNSGMGYMYAYYLIHEKMSVGDALLTVRANTSKNHWWPNMLTYTIYGLPDLKLDTEEKVTFLDRNNVRSTIDSGTRMWMNIAHGEFTVSIGQAGTGRKVSIGFYDLSGRLLYKTENIAPCGNSVRIRLPEAIRSTRQTILAGVRVGEKTFTRHIVNHGH